MIPLDIMAKFGNFQWSRCVLWGKNVFFLAFLDLENVVLLYLSVYYRSCGVATTAVSLKQRCPSTGSGFLQPTSGSMTRRQEGSAGLETALQRWGETITQIWKRNSVIFYLLVMFLGLTFLLNFKNFISTSRRKCKNVIYCNLIISKR
jgi:hypothetical protein